jgi:hypothetical protein
MTRTSLTVPDRLEFAWRSLPGFAGSEKLSKAQVAAVFTATSRRRSMLIGNYY